MGQCPVCGKSFRIDILGAHADQCAARIEEKRPPVPRQAPGAKSRSGKRKASSAPDASGRAGGARTAAARRRMNSEAARPFFEIESVPIDEFEFRCQSIRAQGGAPRLIPGERPGSAAQQRSAGAAGSAAGQVGVRSSSAKVARESTAAAKERSGAGKARTAAEGGANTSAVTLQPSSPANASSRAAIEEASVERDAEQFCADVRAALEDEPEAQQTFMAGLVGFQDGWLDTIEVSASVVSFAALACCRRAL